MPVSKNKLSKRSALMSIILEADFCDHGFHQQTYLCFALDSALYCKNLKLLIVSCISIHLLWNIYLCKNKPLKSDMLHNVSITHRLLFGLNASLYDRFDSEQSLRCSFACCGENFALFSFAFLSKNRMCRAQGRKAIHANLNH